MDILHRSDLVLHRFAGARQYRLVTDARAPQPQTGEGGRDGLGALVCLTDTRIDAGGETGARECRELDVVTLVVDGRITHRGSLEDGSLLPPDEVLVQRTGVDGFSCNETNQDDKPGRIVQLSLLPDVPSGAADCRRYRPGAGQVTRVYGGESEREAAYAATTCVEVALLRDGQSLDVDKPFLAYLVLGEGFANEDRLSEGTLFSDRHLSFDATDDSCLLIVHQLS
jgi:redox-sensitive bicupin YhaK (pirin superfamily)